METLFFKGGAGAFFHFSGGDSAITNNKLLSKHENTQKWLNKLLILRWIMCN